MKNLVIIISALFAISFKANCQHPTVNHILDGKGQYTFFYKVQWTPDSTDVKSKASETARLDIMKDASYFQSTGNYLMDSLKAHFDVIGLTQQNVGDYSSARNSMPHSVNSYVIQKSKDLRSINFYERLGGKRYYYVDSFPVSHWVIKDSIQKYMGYTCKKATIDFRGRLYIAWFTEEIPVAEGPYKFCGLPGLIVKIKDSRSHYSFTLSKIAALSPQKAATSFKNAILASRIYLVKGKRDYYANLFNIVGSINQDKPSSPAEIKEGRERVRRKFNNSMELR